MQILNLFRRCQLFTDFSHPRIVGKLPCYFKIRKIRSTSEGKGRGWCSNPYCRPYDLCLILCGCFPANVAPLIIVPQGMRGCRGQLFPPVLTIHYKPVNLWSSKQGRIIRNCSRSTVVVGGCENNRHEQLCIDSTLWAFCSFSNQIIGNKTKSQRGPGLVSLGEVTLVNGKVQSEMDLSIPTFLTLVSKMYLGYFYF